MKCPYRKITRKQHNEDNYVIYEDFADCYKGECPYYSYLKLSHCEECLKVINEN